MFSYFLAAALSAAPVNAAKADAAPGKDAAKSGGLDVSKMPFTPFSIQEVVKSHLPAIQQCYDQVVLEAGGKPPQGRVMVHFTILPNGLTTQAKVVPRKTTLRNDRVHDCIIDEIRRWEFPQPTDGRPQPVDYPFDLKVQKEKK